MLFLTYGIDTDTFVALLEGSTRKVRKGTNYTFGSYRAFPRDNRKGT